ncbi:hypothetical protein [Oceanobacillus senegalensis]|uniref:hypothetical protein n=1 Tax=Oceanobacillus senegalensis TaxID=1936063 RepID=UPI000A30E520|nr:hypothetical protein [Oceanobacillus senegalensis]
MVNRKNEKLIEVKGKVRKKHKWQGQLMDYENERIEIKKTIQDLSVQLDEESKDVEKLKGISVTNLIQTLIGQKEEKLEKEKQEVITAQLRLEEAKKAKMEVELEIEVLQNKIGIIGNVEKDYQQILLEKENIMKQSKKYEIYSKRVIGCTGRTRCAY